jgi:hypothetical protein
MSKKTSKRAGGSVEVRPDDSSELVSVGRAAELLAMRHEGVADAIRGGKIRAVLIEGTKGAARWAIRRDELRRYRAALVERYSASKTPARRLLARELESAEI